MNPVETFRGQLTSYVLERLEDVHAAVIVAVRAASAVLEDNHCVEAGALRQAEHALGEAIAELRMTLPAEAKGEA
jgi:hypothetical protein